MCVEEIDHDTVKAVKYFSRCVKFKVLWVKILKGEINFCIFLFSIKFQLETVEGFVGQSMSFMILLDITS